MSRSDAHSPSSLMPEEYTLVGFLMPELSFGDFDPTDGQLQTIEDLEMMMGETCCANGVDVDCMDEMPQPEFDGNHRKKGTCDHCGAAFMYKCVFQHRPTGEHIAVGFTCAQLVFPESNLGHAQKRLQKRMKTARSRVANMKRFNQWIADNQKYSWLATEAEETHPIAKSMRSKLLAYGSLSDKQLGLLDKLRNPAVACPTPFVPEPWGSVESHSKRSTVIGTVVGIKEERDPYSYHDRTIYKCMVKAGNRKIWMSLPSALPAVRGLGVRFDAQLIKKDNDFYLGKRPTKPVVLFEPAA